MSKDFSVFNLKCLQDQRDTEFVEELMNVLGDEVKEIENFNVYKKLCNTDVPKQVKEIESFVIVYKYKDRFTSPFARTLRVITKMFGETLKHMFSDSKYDLNSGNFWTNVVILVNFWSFNPLHVEDRLNKRVGFIINDLC